jgi:thymidylate kinase
VTQTILSSPVTARPPDVLGVVRDLFDQLAAAQVTYCHWKSNEHLDAAIRGATDLDVLVDREAGSELASLLEKIGFKRIAAVPARAYPGVEDYLAMDWSSGRLAHLHLHYRLVLGERNLKGYSLPWESLVLQTRQLDAATGIFVCDPNLELILLAVRAALKLRHRDFLTPPWRATTLPTGTLDEFLWLLSRVDRARLRQLAEDLVGKDAAELLLAMTGKLPSLSALRRFGSAADPFLRDHRTYQPLEAARRRWSRELQGRWARLRDRMVEGSLPHRHTLPHGGLVIAFLGSDGSGKSTVVREIAAWLSWKIDVRTIYLGSGDGPVSLLRRPLRAAAALRARLRRAPAPFPSRDVTTSLAPEDRATSRLPRAIGRSLLAVVLAREKLDRLAEARRARNLGMVALCDRYPQAQFAGFYDGPQLESWSEHPSRWFRAVSAWELAAYRSAERSRPDLVVKLHVTPQVAAQRKNDRGPEDVMRRVAATRTLRFPADVRVVDIDATQSLDQVLLQVRRAIWEII